MLIFSSFNLMKRLAKLKHTKVFAKRVLDGLICGIDWMLLPNFTILRTQNNNLALIFVHRGAIGHFNQNWRIETNSNWSNLNQPNNNSQKELVPCALSIHSHNSSISILVTRRNSHNEGHLMCYIFTIQQIMQSQHC